MTCTLAPDGPLPAVKTPSLTPGTRPGIPRLANLHVLRGLAALAVVYYHITSEAGLDVPFNVGTFGVDVFFVISGFIIPYTASASPKRFFLRRVLRIVPFYWAATIGVFTLALAAPGLLRSTQPDVRQLVCSLLFIPRETAYAGQYPTLILGWSLNYEMYFYALFSAALVASRRSAPGLCVLAIAAIAAFITTTGTTSPILTFYANPLVFEFSFGIAAYYLFRSATHSPAAGGGRRVAAGALGLLAVASICGLALAEYHGGYGLPRFVAAGVPAFVLVTSAVLLEGRYGLAVRSGLADLLGESSFVLYLIHPYIIYAVLRLVIGRGRQLPLAADVFVIVALIALAATVAIVVHLLFEQPILARLRRLARPLAN